MLKYIPLEDGDSTSFWEKSRHGDAINKRLGSPELSFLCCDAACWVYLFRSNHVAPGGPGDEGIDADMLLYLLPAVFAARVCICRRTAGWETLIVVYFSCF